MSIVIQYDRNTGEILKVDNHPEWQNRQIRLNWYAKNPKERIKGAGWLTPKPNDNWDGKPSNWVVDKDKNGNPCLQKKEEYLIKQEIECQKEQVFLDRIDPKSISKRAKAKVKKRKQALKDKLTRIRSDLN